MLKSDAAGSREDGFHCRVTGSLSRQDENSNLAATQGSKFIPLESLNVGYSAPTASQLIGQDDSGGRAGFQPVAEGENSNDACSVAPETPQRAPEPNPGTPLTPLANLKVLIAAASSALDRERECASAGAGAGVLGASVTVGGEEGVEEATGRKMKSLAVLCKKFLSIAESEIGAGNEFSLDMMAQSLGTNRRRIYDIINVMEALEMIVKQSKNWYTWLGRGSLITTLAKLRAMALDDSELRALFGGEDDDKENVTTPTFAPEKAAAPSSVAPGNKETAVGVARPPLQAVSGNVVSRKRSGGPGETAEPGETSARSEGVMGCRDDGEDATGPSDGDGGCRGGRWDKSLGVLCQKFVMLFLISPDHEVTLEFAGSVLMPDEDGGPFSASQNPKTKVRRLYDIANVLTTLGLIKKKTFLAPNHRKMPGYSWCGASIREIQAITVLRKSEFGLGSLYPHKKGTSLTRRPSFGSRPFLHQYEVKDAHSSAPATPTKAKGEGFRRSLSFGANNPGSGKSATVLARPLCPKQLDYMKEVKEFEAEMQKHSYRYPHVASVFHEFIQKYQNTLEQTASTGRSILPKPSPINVPGHQQQGGGSHTNTSSLPPADLTVASLLASPCSLPGSNQASPENSLPINFSQISSSSPASIGFPPFSALPNSHPGAIHPILKQINMAMPTSVPPLAAAAATPVTSLAAALSGGGSPKGSKPFRRILPAPCRDPTTELLQRASEIMNQAGVCLSSASLPSTETTGGSLGSVPAAVAADASVNDDTQAQSVVTQSTSVADAEPLMISSIATDSKSSGTLTSDAVCITTGSYNSQSRGNRTSPVEGTTLGNRTGARVSTSATETQSSSMLCSSTPSTTSHTDSRNRVSSPTTVVTTSMGASRKGVSFHSGATTDAATAVKLLSDGALNPQPAVNQSVTSASSKPSSLSLGTIALSEAAAFIDTNSASMNLQVQRPSWSLSNNSSDPAGTDNLMPKKTSMAVQTATLHSPSNPARTGQSFINIEEILTRAGDKGSAAALTTSSTNVQLQQQPPSAPLQEGSGVAASPVALPAFSTTSQLSPPPGVHPLSIFRNLAPACSKPSAAAFSSIVNQKPIPSAFESSQSTMPQSAASPTANSSSGNSNNIGPLLQSLGITINPNTFLANPGSLYCGVPLPIGSGFLPPMSSSSLYSNGHTAGNHYPANTQAVIAATSDSLVSRSSGASPPKRPRLE